MEAINALLDEIVVGETWAEGPLSITALLGARDSHPKYLLLKEALARGLAEVKEVSKQGVVQRARMDNRADLPVLLTEGSELLGAKQNRIVNLSVLAPPRTTLTIPVTCVEQGRWHSDGGHFRSSGRTAYARLRSFTSRSVTAALLQEATPDTDQRAVWADVDNMRAHLSPTLSSTAMAAVFESTEATLAVRRRSNRVVEGQRGVICAVYGRFRGLEIFDTATTARECLPGVLDGYSLDVLQDGNVPKETTPVSSMQLLTWLAALRSQPTREFRAEGLGVNVRLTGEKISGGALVWNDAVVHLHALAPREEGVETLV